MPKCVYCGTEIEVDGRIGRLEDCLKCGRYLHACIQCKLYDRGYHNDCRESQSVMVGDKEKANFCEFFDFGRDIECEEKAIEKAKNDLSTLFKK